MLIEKLCFTFHASIYLREKANLIFYYRFAKNCIYDDICVHITAFIVFQYESVQLDELCIITDLHYKYIGQDQSVIKNGYCFVG